MSEKQYYDQEGEPVTLDKLCRTDPAWAASRIREMTAQRAQLIEEAAEYQRENAALREANKLDAAELGRFRKRVDGELRIKSEFLSSRQCPDHSGKWPRGRCLQCEIEQLQKALREIAEDEYIGQDSGAMSEVIDELKSIAERALAQSNDTPDAEGGVERGVPNVVVTNRCPKCGVKGNICCCFVPEQDRCEVHYWLMGDGKCTCPKQDTPD